MQSVYEIVFSCKNAFENAYLLFSFGVECVEEVSPTQLRCFFRGADQALKELVDESKLSGFKIDLIAPYKDRNWVARCEELCIPLEVGSLKICPIVEPKTHALDDKKTVYIIPSTGFGTGHHATTYMMLDTLQAIEVQDLNPQRILDFGSGSGILAIAAKKIYDCEVEAVEIDSSAIGNLSQNIELNKLEDDIEVLHGGIECLTGNYDLILANVYAEVLCEYEQNFKTHLAPKGLLVLSGIKKQLLEDVMSCYEARWRKVAESFRDDWCMVMFSPNS